MVADNKQKLVKTAVGAVGLGIAGFGAYRLVRKKKNPLELEGEPEVGFPHSLISVVVWQQLRYIIGACFGKFFRAFRPRIYKCQRILL